MRKKLLTAAGSVAMFVFAAGVVFMTLALYRYGGMEGVTDRVRMQFASEQPHDDFVPTPEDVASGPDPSQLAASAGLDLGETASPAYPTAETAVATPTVTDAAPPGNLSAERALEQIASLIQPSDVPVRATGMRVSAAKRAKATARSQPSTTVGPTVEVTATAVLTPTPAPVTRPGKSS